MIHRIYDDAGDDTDDGDGLPKTFKKRRIQWSVQCVHHKHRSRRHSLYIGMMMMMSLMGIRLCFFW